MEIKSLHMYMYCAINNSKLTRLASFPYVEMPNGGNIIMDLKTWLETEVPRHRIHVHVVYLTRLHTKLILHWKLGFETSGLMSVCYTESVTKLGNNAALLK